MKINALLLLVLRSRADEAAVLAPGNPQRTAVDGNAYQRRSKEYHRLGGKARFETAVCNAGTGLEHSSPDIVEAIVNGAEPDGLSIAQIVKNIPEDWNEQRRLFGFPEQ